MMPVSVMLRKEGGGGEKEKEAFSIYQMHGAIDAEKHLQA